ncbi:MAG: Sir2 family NAD-dependent protein deacetylase [Deltaproteobacteria bacterium]|nr:Sir2 family NAD-dependent protein deacetylase [Deltaproteobacteria bacterium]
MTEKGLTEKIALVASMIARAERIVVFTGAGISTESGIPDFRSPGGIWTRFDPDDFTIQKFIASDETRRKQWKILVEEGLFRNIEPNRAHRAIAELEQMGRLDCIITQNIDDLHQKAGSSQDRVYELHGNMQWAKCLDCSSLFAMEAIREQLLNGKEIPLCKRCHGMLKPNVVFFGEQLPLNTIEAATCHAESCDLFIVVGSSLAVQPASFMPGYAKAAGASLVIVNMSPTPCDRLADVVITEMAGKIMPRIVTETKKLLKNLPC